MCNSFSNIIELDNIDGATKKLFKEMLTFPNPEWETKQKMGLWMGNTPQYIKLYEDHASVFKIPFGMLANCFRVGLKIDNTDFANVPVEEAKSSIELREYQARAVKQIIKQKNGIILMFAGAGKTETAIQSIVELKQKTLWLTHTHDLVLQAQKRCVSKTSLSTSLITEGKADLSGDVVFCTVQTLSKMLDDIDCKTFGALYVDETHRISSFGMFQRCVEHFKCRYKIGLTATAHRADGLFDIVKAILGEVIYEMVRDDKLGVFHCVSYSLQTKTLDCDVLITMFQVPAKIIPIYSDYTVDNEDVYDAKTGTIIYSKLISDVAMNADRNEQILELLQNLKDKRVLILSDRLDQLEYLHESTPSSLFINGKTKKKQREQNIENMRNENANCLFATWKLAKEGLDIPCIDTIIFATPNKDYAVIIQAVGRGQRPYKNKTSCTVYDFIDANCGILVATKKKRFNIYKSNGMEVI